MGKTKARFKMDSPIADQGGLGLAIGVAWSRSTRTAMGFAGWTVCRQESIVLQFQSVNAGTEMCNPDQILTQDRICDWINTKSGESWREFTAGETILCPTFPMRGGLTGAEIVEEDRFACEFSSFRRELRIRRPKPTAYGRATLTGTAVPASCQSGSESGSGSQS